MPFKSAAQRRKFAELLVAGKISAETYEEWNRDTGSRKLPDHVKRKAGAKGKRPAVRKAASKQAARRRKAAGKKTAAAPARRARKTTRR